MDREGITDSDLYDWERSSNDVSPVTTTSTTAFLYRSTPPENKIPNVEKSDVPTGYSYHQVDDEKNEQVYEQNKLNKAEGEHPWSATSHYTSWLGLLHPLGSCSRFLEI